ncbi:MAG: hypothetical protein AAF978_08820 [Cyanobacteria bacterium P01_E01_bin.48]
MLLGVAGAASAWEATAQTQRQQTLEQLPPGIYQVCEPSEPHPSGLQLGQCFRFEKMGDRQVAGVWFRAHTDSSICVGGTVEENRLTGRAISFLYDWDVPPTLTALQGGYRDDTGYFTAQSPSILEVTETESDFLSYTATVLYTDAVLDAEGLVFTDLRPEFAIDNCLQALEARGKER